MNFKITLWKIVISLIIGLVLGTYLTYLFYDVAFTKIGFNNSPSIILLIAGIIITILIVYIIWSLIQKKN